MSNFDAHAAAANDACLSLFGDPMTWTPAVGSPATISAIERPSSFLEGVAPGQNRVYWIRRSDFPAGSPSVNDTITISSTVYRIIQIQNEPDGGGGADIVLTKS